MFEADLRSTVLSLPLRLGRSHIVFVRVGSSSRFMGALPGCGGCGRIYVRLGSLSLGCNSRGRAATFETIVLVLLLVLGSMVARGCRRAREAGLRMGLDKLGRKAVEAMVLRLIGKLRVDILLTS